MAIQAHLLGKTYGMTPTEVLGRPASDFWLDAQIRAAGVVFEKEEQEARREAGTGPGAATGREKRDLVEDQEERASARESRDGNAPLDDQLAALKEEHTDD